MRMNVRAFGGETLRSTVLGTDQSGNANNSCPFDHSSPNLVMSLLQCSAGPTQALGGGISYVAPGMQGQYTQELIFGGEYEILPDFTVGANYVHRTLPVVIEDMSTDGGASYFIANPSENFDSEAAKLEQQANAMTDPSQASLKALYL